MPNALRKFKTFGFEDPVMIYTTLKVSILGKGVIKR